MDELVTIAGKLSEIGFPTLLVLILYGNYKGVWVWGEQLRKSEAEALGWKTMTLQAVGLAETSVNIAKTRVQ